MDTLKGLTAQYAGWIKDLLAAASVDAPTCTTGVLVRPGRFGLFELGRVDWIDHPCQYAATVVLADGAGQVFAATLTGDHARAEEELGQVDMGALEPLVATPQAMHCYLADAEQRFAAGPRNVGAPGAVERLICAVRYVLPQVAAA